MPAPFCGAKNRAGGACGRPAGWGTQHLGIGRCKHHGGSTPSHQIAAAPQLAVVMGAPLDIEPHDALLWCVRVTAGEVNYCSAMVARLEREEAVGKPVLSRDWVGSGETGQGGGSEQRELAPALNIWIVARRDAVDRLARYSKMALDAGVAERQVRLAERYGEQIGQLLSGVLAELKLTAEQQRRAPDVVRRHLVALEGGLSEAA
jgi:hypothetical protein